LRLKPNDILGMTQREFSIIASENIEATYDDMERNALVAIFHAAASRGKGKNGKMFKVDELFKRPNGEEESVPLKKRSAEDIQAEMDHANEWLAQFGLNNGGKEDD